MKEFIERHFRRILFVIMTAIVTVMAVLSNHGYGNFFQMTEGDTSHRYYHDNDSYNRNRSSRQPWTMQKPSSSRSSKSSSSSRK